MSGRRNAVDAKASQKNRGDSRVRSEIEEVYKTAARATKGKDVKGITGFLTSDAKTQGLDGTTLTRAEWEADIERDFAGVQSFDRAEYRINKLTVNGDEAVVYLTEEFSGVVVAAGNSKPEKFSSTMFVRDVLRKTGDGWKVQFSETITDDMDIDGQKFSSSAHAR